MPDFPQEIPDDLRRALEEIEARRTPPTSQDRWGVIREWLGKHGIDAPADLPRRPEPRMRE